MTPVSVMLDPTTGTAKRIAITSTARVEKPSMKAMTQGVGKTLRSDDMDRRTLTLWRVLGDSRHISAPRRGVVGHARSGAQEPYWTGCVRRGRNTDRGGRRFSWSGN